MLHRNPVRKNQRQPQQNQKNLINFNIYIIAKQKSPYASIRASYIKKAATYSPTCVVPSALKGLTSLFGMGKGVSPSLWPPLNLWTFVLFSFHKVWHKKRECLVFYFWEVFELLVLLGSLTPHGDSTCNLSSWSSSTSLKEYSSWGWLRA